MADTPRTAGMIALIPTTEDAHRLAVAGGEDPDDLHLTLVYLGDDVTDWDDEVVDQLTTDLDEATTALGGRLAARVMGHAAFNPDGGPDADRDPCAVYLVGDTNQVGPLRDSVLELLARHKLPIATQHDPYLPHVTAGDNLDAAGLAGAGPIQFDRLRLALGDQEIDVPLGEALAELEEKSVPVRPAPRLPARRHAAGRATESRRVEVKVASPDPRAARLRAYWAHGKGLKKWFRGLDVAGNFRRLRRALATKHVPARMLDGLTANIYHEATGQWPGRRASKTLPHVVEHKSLWDFDDPDADMPDEVELALCEGIDEWGTEFLDRDDIADPDGDTPGEPAAAEIGAETSAEIKAAGPALGMVTIPAADLDPDLMPGLLEVLGAEPDPRGVDQLMLDVDAAILAADQFLLAEETTDEDDESWVDVASRDRAYQVGADGVLAPVDDSASLPMSPPVRG